MSEGMRAAVTGAAVKAAKAIHYSGAGTIEFIADASDGLRPDRFWFMEMNTRLQVEHPVTEMVTGLDLVEWQLRVAAGETLPRTQGEIALSGHAFEARIYAEDASRGFLPATGTLHHLKFPDAGPALRVETGVRAGDAISPFYDPMIAKLVVHGPDRSAALGALSEALEATEIAGSVTNIAFLAALARDPDFAVGDVDTGLIARKQEALTTAQGPSPEMVSAAILAASGLDAMPHDDDPWSLLSGYAHFHPIERRTSLRSGATELVAFVGVQADGRTMIRFDGEHEKNKVSKDIASSTARWPGHVTVFSGGAAYDFAVPDPFAKAAETEASAGSMRAPMPGLVKIVRASKGDAVTKGQTLLILEAMKMEHTISAPHDGVVADIAAEGAQITEGTVLVTFEEASA
jgi:3-methylcrotonyl-CoA carboxylase alpha subunit